MCTMSYKSYTRSHAEESRKRFASCVKEVTANAKVNVAMSDKPLVKNLPKEVERLESELRRKDARIEKLEEEIRNLILQRDIAQSQVKELLQILGDNAGPLTRVGLGNYPHLRVRKSPDQEIQRKETSAWADTHSLDVDTRRGQRDSYQCWEEAQNENKETLEDRCKGIHCISAEKMLSEDYTGIPVVKVRVNGEMQDVESASSGSSPNESCMSSPLNDDDNEVKQHEASEIIPPNEGQKLIAPSAMDDKESFQMLKNKRDFSCLQCLVITSLDNPLQYLGITSLENPSLAHHLAGDTFGSGGSSFPRMKRRKASIFTSSISPWLTEKQCSDYTSSLEPGKESDDFGWKTSALKFSPAVEDDSLNCTPDTRREAELSNDKEYTAKPENDAASKVTESHKKNVNDVGVHPVEDESKVVTSWPVEFRRLQRQIIELWHTCHVSLVHRTYFFLLCKGDPSDAIYLEVEIRKLKFLKEKFSQGEKAVVNGQRLTLSSSKKALRQERQALAKQMMKKFSEKERERMFLEWGISLNTKMRRQQLADRVWAKTDDMNHIAESALLVAKLVGIIEPGQSLNKEMFGLDFTPKPGSGISSTFKRSLVSIL
ncbi:kinesin-like protein KIN-7H isoform X2 [Andrographis paniculata]|uniref:kinesin-like protein KIN-7H isoform X2 n=1 Tax=Andrographis paniculata TaxID=175694 RepID=UPI0021E994DC|nr:kinesin-like protein KIN-7H isoform X2 [Andrographis paniculata]